jgi:hypothetical protein
MKKDLEIRADEACPKDCMFLVSPRKYIDVLATDGSLVARVWEPEADWAKRCAVIKLGSENAKSESIRDSLSRA